MNATGLLVTLAIVGILVFFGLKSFKAPGQAPLLSPQEVSKMQDEARRAEEVARQANARVRASEDAARAVVQADSAGN